LVVPKGGATDQVLLNNPFQNGGCAGVVPDLIRVNDCDGTLLADPQAIGLGAHDLWIGPAGQTQLVEAEFEVLPRFQSALFGAAFGVCLIATEKDVTDAAVDADSSTNGMEGFCG